MEWSRWLLESYRHWTGHNLVEPTDTAEHQACTLFEAPLIVVSHGAEQDPILNYGNQAALDLWETTWEQLIRMPSRLTTEPVNQAERERVLAIAKSKGFYDGYRGVRISSTGRRFLVEHAVIWTVRNETGTTVGQAATFSRWTSL